MFGKKKKKNYTCSQCLTAVQYQGELCAGCKAKQFQTKLDAVLVKMRQYEHLHED